MSKMNDQQRVALCKTTRNSKSEGQPRYLQQLPGNSGWRPTGCVQIIDAPIHQNTEVHGRPNLQRSRVMGSLRKAYQKTAPESLDEAGPPNKLRRASASSSEPVQGTDVDRDDEAIVPPTQQRDDQTDKHLGHVREYQVHVHHPVERPKSIEVQLCHVDDEDEP
ncbi:uncharacterized protein BKA55DRAFT_732457 [Fusarium redolens]|uniref:Uncharacterized protein n=1 Tax=Fusarium redolens TaxID=48865 RepID=A0A9P9R9U1_FUSRE|nr:uncharacterized protein BKA55DRAFT_732457 [Fusarium redolens]KAH7270325.1 hypothetical protein BKA55DRAFT_732457 [Fusarium redolens]